MDVEVNGFEPAPAPFQTENGKPNSEHVFSEPIKFGTHEEEEDKLEAKVDAVESDIPKKTAADWPESKKIHNFYLVTYRKYQDPKLVEKIDRAKQAIELMKKARSEIFDELDNLKKQKLHIIPQLIELNKEDKAFREIRKSKREDMQPFTDALGSLRSLNGGKGDHLCSTEEELDSLIRQKNNLIQHETLQKKHSFAAKRFGQEKSKFGRKRVFMAKTVLTKSSHDYSLRDNESNTLAREKELVNEIKQLEQTRKKVKANEVERKKVVEAYGKKELIQDQVKFMGDDYGEVKKDHQVVINKKKKLEDELTAIKEEIESLKKKLDDDKEKKDKAYENLQKLRKQQDEGNANHYKYWKVLNNARNVAMTRDVNALKELTETEAGKFLHLWNKSDGLRDDYEKRIAASLDNRSLSKDGRIRNPGEKLIIQAPPAELSVETASEGLKTNAKAPKADSKVGLQNGSPAIGKIKEGAHKKPEESVKISTESQIEEEEEEFFLPVKASTTEKEIDETTLKKLKQQEQREKYEQYLKRQNKLAERKQRAVILSEQGATEKKLTKSEKKAKKGTVSEPDVDPKESTEAVSDIIEPEETVQTPEAPVPSKKKNNRVRNRNISKAPKSIPKAILKRKKAANYWMWGGAAGIVCLILLALIYQYLL